MSIVTVTTEQVRELIQQLAAMTSSASITPEIVANIFENLRQLNDQERAKVIATAEAYIAEIQNTGVSADKVLLDEGTGLKAGNAQDALAEISKVLDKKIESHEDDSNANVNVGDRNGYVVLQLKNGHIRTKNFNSATNPIGADDSSDSDLSFSDDNGNVVLQLKDGHLKTKKFDSSKVSESGNWLKGKTVAIIGDSISTNGNPGTGDNANVPEIKITAEDVGVELSAYVTYYDVEHNLTINNHAFTSAEIGTEVTFTPTVNDVGKVIGYPLTYNANSRKVWWEHAAEVLGFTPIPVCWSGSSITSHEENLQQGKYKCAHAWHPSQIRKCGIRVAGSMTRTAPDVIIIYRGTNDFSHSPNTRLTEDYFKSGVNFAYPVTDIINTNDYGYKEGITLTISKLRESYPLAKIILCTLNVFKRNSYSHYPTRNNYNSLPEYNNAIREAADYLGCGLIEFDKDGITFENGGVGDYFADYNSSNQSFTHPNDKGHKVMGMKAIADLLAQGYTDNIDNN